MSAPTFAEQAVEHQLLADRALAKSDRLFDAGKERAAVAAAQEGRREQAIADRYRALAAGEQS